MTIRIQAAGLPLALTLVLMAAASCDRKPDAADAPKDTSEVVAKFYGEPITLSDLQTENPNAASPEAYRAALSDIIDRKLLARATAADTAAGGDLELAYEKEKGAEIALANARGRQLVKGAAAPTPSDVQRYIAEHPEAFSNRRFLIVDQVEIRGGTGKLAGLPEARSLAELTAQLDAGKIPYQRTMAVVDTANAQPAIVQRLLSTPSGGLFNLGDSRLAIVGQVKEVHTVPFTNAFATQVATNLIKTAAMRDAVRKDLQTQRAQAVDEIEYVVGYARPLPAAKPAAQE